MDRKNFKSVQNEEQSENQQSKSRRHYKLLKSTSHKKFIFNKAHDNNRYSSRQTSSVLTSLAHLTDQLESNRNVNNELISHNKLPQFTQKYTERKSTQQQLYNQMIKTLRSKQNEFYTLSVYRDELKFIKITKNMRNQGQKMPNFKISLKLLQDKAEVLLKMKSQKWKIKELIEEMQNQKVLLKEYRQVIIKQIEQENDNDNNILDIGKQKQMIIQNMKTEIDHLIRQLQEQKKKNLKQIKSINDYINRLRIVIKQKQDQIKLKNLKMCTLHMKLNNRNSSRGRSHDRNLSMSVRKFNRQSNEKISQTFIGNHQFKPFSKQILQKVASSQQFVKIRFYYSKQKLFFQCIYDKRQGLVHSSDIDTNKYDPVSVTTRNQQLQSQQIYVKYLMSMKFYFKSKLVGVQCRVKTDKGNKHLQIGNCDHNLQHNLMTLVNKKLNTIGSHWHLRQMIGVSVWWTEQTATIKKIDSSKKVEIKNNKNINSYDQYFT